MLARCLVAFALVVATPAVAQYQPAGPTAPAAANWVSVGTNEVGTGIWFDASTIVVDGYYRSAWFRFDRPGGALQSHLIQFDCDGGLYRQMTVQPVNGVPTRVPASDWVAFDEGSGPQGPLASSASREKLCGWGR